ncbi:hypothetical protein F444_23188, partial [Phytophthora nicotianae P1976]
ARRKRTWWPLSAGAVQHAKTDFVPDVSSLFCQNLKMDLAIDDCDARIIRYYESFNAVVEDNILYGLLGADNVTEAGRKRCITATTY